MHGFMTTVKGFVHAVQTRRHLAEMDDRMLSDLGISRVDALAEAQRAPWDVSPFMPLRSKPYLRTLDGCDLRGGRCGAGAR